MNRWTLTFATSCALFGVVGLWWSDWMLLAGAVGSAAAAAWSATELDKPMT